MYAIVRVKRVDEAAILNLCKYRYLKWEVILSTGQVFLNFWGPEKLDRDLLYGNVKLPLSKDSPEIIESLKLAIAQFDRACQEAEWELLACREVEINEL